MVTKLQWNLASLLLFYGLMLLGGFPGISTHAICNHHFPKHHEVLHTYLEPHRKVKRGAADQSLRILLYYDQSVYRLDEERFMLINNTILPEAVSFWEKALSVRRPGHIIRLTRKCSDPQIFVKGGHTYCIEACSDKTICGEVEVPEEHLDVCRVCNSTGQHCMHYPGSKQGKGILDFDFVFYVSAMQTERCNKSLTVAYASHCQQESVLDRPIAGHANLCPNSISTGRQELEILLSTVKHEILHALGFSVSLYAFFRDKDGNPLTERSSETGKPPLNESLQTYQWSNQVINTFTRPWLVKDGYTKKEVQMIVTPSVIQEVRNYFNCSELEGAELEDQGEEGTALTHWEKRVFENEAMTGTHTQNPIISRITLALMEDTGWYKANYSMAEQMSWGRNLGCDFVMKSCKDWINMKSSKGASIHPFCNKIKRDPLHTECTEDRSSVALCNLVEYKEELPKMYQNFDSLEYVEPGNESYFGGSVSLADYCPYIQEFTWRSNNVVVRGSHCRYPENNPRSDKNFALETYGENSKCFEHTDQMWDEKNCKQIRQWMHWGSGCYAYQCREGRLHIMVTNYTYTCYHANQPIYIRIKSNGWLHKGAIVCPPCKEVCGKEFEKQGKRCYGGEEAPPSTSYHRDELKCGSNLSKVSLFLFFFLLCLSFNSNFTK